ncbi:MAG: 3',5'-cyclic-AMP phosphodiesterase [Chromatiales bacterium]|jgi:Icc protein
MRSHINNCTAVKNLFADLPDGSLRILQITDTHLYADTDGTLLGMNTQDTLEQVLAMTRDCGNIDCILSTGDLVHDASESGYKRYQAIFESLGIPVYCLPGNHDIPDMMRRCLTNSTVEYITSAVHGPWLFVFLDSTVPDGEGGHFSGAELQMLDKTLAAHPDKHALVCLHHHPVPVNSAWMDTMQVDNPADFFHIIDKYPQVQGILWGHVHQEYDQERMGVRLLASPSTCIQFAPQQDDFGVDDEPPGCRWLALLPDGEIRTVVTRLDSVPEGLEINSAGY